MSEERIQARVMQRKDEQSELLFQLLQKEGTDVIHLPYTPAFENVCSALSKKPSIEDKHKLWERVLELQSHSQVEKPPTVCLGNWCNVGRDSYSWATP